MKILHVIPSLNPATGGPPVVAARLAAAQSQLGCSTRIVSYQFPHAQKNIEASLLAVPHFESVQCDFLAPLSRYERVFASGARRDLAPWVRQADIIHLHGVWDPIVAAAARVAREQDRPYCLTPHGMLDPWAMGQKKWKKKIAMALGYRRILNDATFLHFLNADEQSLAAPLHLEIRARVVPNGIFLEEVDPLPDAGGFYAAHPELKARPFILFLSRLHYKKGLDYLADAAAIVFKKLPDVQLVVAGPDDGARAGFIRQIQALGISNRVHLVGPLYGVAKLQALVDAACFCLPSRQEGFSLAITEALATATAVVISSNCHFPEVDQAGAGVVVELRADAIAQGLLRVLTDSNEAQRMGQAGREMVIERFTWPAVARRMIDAYERSLSGNLGV